MVATAMPLTDQQLRYVGTREGPHKRNRNAPRRGYGDWLKQVVFAIRELQTENPQCYISVLAVVVKLNLGQTDWNSSNVRKAFVRLAHNYSFDYQDGVIRATSAAYEQFARGETNGCTCKACRSDLHYPC